MKNAIIFLFLLISFPLFSQKWKPIYAPFDSLVMRAECFRNDVAVRAELTELAEKMTVIAESRNDDRLRWRALFWKGSAKLDRENAGDNAIIYINQALNLVDSSKYEYDYRRMLWEKTVCSGLLNQIERFREAQKALRYFRSVDDKLMMAVMCLNIADSYWRMNILTKAMKYFEEGFGYYRDIGFENAIRNYERLLLGLFIEVGDTLAAKRIYEEAIHSKEAIDTIWLIITYDDAFIYGLDSLGSFKAFDLAHEFGNPFFIKYTTAKMGCYRIDENDYAAALAFFIEARDIDIGGDVSKDFVDLSILKGLAECYDHLGLVDSAYYYSQRYYSLRDSLDAINNIADFQEMYEKLALEREEEHVAQEQEKAHNKLLITILSFSLALLGAIAAIHYFISRRKLKEAENKELAGIVKTEQLQRQLYQEQTENRERELTTNSLLLIEKKKMIDSLNRQIEQHGQEGKIESHAQRELQNFIRLHQGTEESFKHFYDYFSQVHPDFFTMLKERYPSLTKGDLRLCAYIRIGLDNKQIAQTLAIQPDAVKKARYRLRQKFGLETQDSLAEFLLLQKERRDR